MLKLWNALRGAKSYIVAAATVIYGGVELWSGAMTVDQAMAFIFGGSGLAALRHGMSGTVLAVAEQVLPVLLRSIPPRTMGGGEAPAPLPTRPQAIARALLPLASFVAIGVSLVACAGGLPQGIPVQVMGPVDVHVSSLPASTVTTVPGPTPGSMVSTTVEAPNPLAIGTNNGCWSQSALAAIASFFMKGGAAGAASQASALGGLIAGTCPPAAPGGAVASP